MPPDDSLQQQKLRYDSIMTRHQQISFTLLRLALASLFLYSSISKLIEGHWTSAGLLNHATTFPELFTWFASPANIGWVDASNIYGQLLLGVALLLGVFLPVAALAGTLLMAMYYTAQLHFPYAGSGTTSLLIDQHVIISLSLFVLWFVDAGRYYGLKKVVENYLPRPLRKIN